MCVSGQRAHWRLPILVIEHTGPQLPVGEVLVAIVDRLELAAVNSSFVIT